MKKNRINRTGQYGMYLQNVNYQLGSGTTRSEISNNMIGGIFNNTSPYGVYINAQMRNVDFWHNTINVVNLGSGYAFFMQYTSPGTFGGLDFRNNSITATNNTNYVAYFYFTPNNPFTVFSNNNIYGSNTASTTALFSCSGYSTNSWLGSGSSCVAFNNVNCIWLPPQYINDATDLHSLSNNLSNVGVNIATVTTDIDGDTRPLSPSSTVDIGADEYNVPAENIGAISVITPVAPITVGLQNVVVQIRNFGSATITAANVRYKVGVNGSIKTVAWTGSIATNATANVTFTGANQYNFTGSFDTIIAWTDAPNGLPDGFVLNDTFVNNVVCQPLAGVYTLDPGLPASTTNFVNFSSMAARLNNCGVTGPVTVNVAAGTYTEQFELKQFPGISAANNVTIQSASGVASSVILQFNTASLAANNYVVYMNGTDYTKFQNMTMTNTNTGVGSYIIWQVNNSRFNTFQNVVFNGAITTSNSTNYSIIYANNTNAVNAGQGDDNNTFNQCVFNNGSYGFYYYGSYSSYYSYNTVITNNTFTNQSYTGINIQFHFNANISGNTITTNTNNTYYGINFYGAGVTNSGNAFISKNNINIALGYGIYTYYFIGNNSFVTNNMIKIGSGTVNPAVGLYTNYTMCKIYHNTVNVTSGSTNNQAVYLYYGCCYSPFTDFKFNIVSNTGNGSTAGLCIYSDVNNPSNMKIDSNVYFQGTGASNFGNLGGGNHATFTAWKTAMGATYDPASVVANPNFFSASNLHINSGTNLRAVPVSPFVTDDIDNFSRCGLTDAGADHHPGANDIGASLILYPFGGVASPGLQDVKVVIRNFGSNTVTSANVSYNINGTIATKAWTGSLATCATDTVVFTGAQQYNFAGGFTMKAYTDGPNGATDVNVSNDTLYSGGCLGMAGNYTIDPAGSGPSNYTTFGAAIAAMQVCGIGGPINLLPRQHIQSR
ncbi:MAG: hypothetical protein IPK03_09125 [Bacteroidetes bacterium]|nr:hypothetical protein [Bacteroidota bacterium]